VQRLTHIFGMSTDIISRLGIIRAFRQPFFDGSAISGCMIIHAASEAKITIGKYILSVHIRCTYLRTQIRRIRNVCLHRLPEYSFTRRTHDPLCSLLLRAQNYLAIWTRTESQLRMRLNVVAEGKLLIPFSHVRLGK